MKKLLDEDGKILGLINPIDLAIIIILFGLGLKIIADYRPAPLDLKQHQVTIGLLVKNIPPYLAESITVGQDLFQDGSNTYLGKIYRTKKEPAQLLLKNNGQIVVVLSPRNLDLRLTLTNRGRIITGPARTGIFLGKLAVRVGDKLKAHSLYTSIHGEIEYLRIKSHVR